MRWSQLRVEKEKAKVHDLTDKLQELRALARQRLLETEERLDDVRERLEKQRVEAEASAG